MWATIPRPSSVLWRIPQRQSGSRPQARASFVSTGDVLMSSRPPKGDGDGDGDASPELQVTSPGTRVDAFGHSDLRFDRLQLPELECNCTPRRVFGRFIARGALLDEEFWTAAWLRAESHWEDQSYVRRIESYKRKFAEQEFAAIRRRCSWQNAEKCTCIVAVKREEKNVKHTVLNSVVGTLDISIRFLLQGEKFPGDRMRASVFSSICNAEKPRYAYVANLCVAKHARRQGIATNMLHLAAEAAKSSGVNQMFVHVYKDNVPAQQLYEKLGFHMVEVTTPQEQKNLMCVKC